MGSWFDGAAHGGEVGMAVGMALADPSPHFLRNQEAGRKEFCAHCFPVLSVQF